MTKALSNTPLWPYIGVVCCLLILTLLSPRSWDNVEEDPVAAVESQSQATITAREIASPTPDDSAPYQASARIALNAENQKHEATNGVGGQATNELLSLAEFQTARRVANISPPVAERVEFDPSLDHAPSLPSPDPSPGIPRIEIAPRLTPPTAVTESVAIAVSRKEAETSPHISTFWPLPQNLLMRLDQVARYDGCREWADRVRFTLKQLHRTESLHASEVTEFIDILEVAVQEGTALAKNEKRAQTRSEILRANYSVARRVEIWKQIREVVQGQTVPVALRSDDDVQLLRRADAVESALKGTVQGEAWRNYLLLTQLREAVGTHNARTQHRLARQILSRMESESLAPQQLELLQSSPFSDLAYVLKRWADEPVDCMALLDDIEAYEESRRVDAAQSLARLYQNSRWSTNPEVEELSRLLNSHYRNANIRVAIASDLLNRMIPEIDPTDEDVDEYIQGTRVYGVSRVHTKLRATLVPDSVRWRVGVEASGEVTSSTAASAGPATFYNQALSRYLARKLLIVERNGVSVWRAEAEADSEAGLTGFQTDFDRVPILGRLARSIALDQHDSRFHSARREAEEMLAERVSKRLDEEVHSRLEKAEKEFDEKLWSPMKSLGLNPAALDLHTSKTRLIGRYRLAGDHQLGAHTPRPQAPSDSLLSAQLHESALNNIIEQLHLDGKESDLHDLYREIGAIFAHPELEAPDDVPEGVTIRFADSEPIRVRFEQGRVIVTLRIAELSRGWRHKWKNFAVRAYYVPDPTQLDANLVREGSIELDGEHITSLDRVALSGVFSKTLSRNRPFNLINKRIAQSESLQDLQVTQFVVTEGWIGVALGPQYGATVHRMAVRPDGDTSSR
ncbi:MAG: hypothetical protein H6822_13735 [Planctomycetaceae bacterium]|nr:hypothetical protein [Planctomycetales bacterium]MCB9923238.1 hypothetical protein [Planctomycetaceae bacterium]